MTTQSEYVQTDYFKSAIPEPYRILGLALKPLSLGHYFILRRFGCAFVSDGPAAATREDLIFGVLVCSMPYEEFLLFINTKKFLTEVKAWGKKVGIFDLPSKAKLFKEYLEQGTQIPKYWFDEENGNESGAHWSQGLLTTLTSQVGYSRHEALNTPLSQALADFYKYAEDSGLIQLVSPEEMEELRLQEEYAKAQANAAKETHGS